MEIMEFSKKLKDNIKLVIKGKDEIIDKVIICLLSSGHILLEDVPGTGKTTLVKALSKSMNLGFSRVLRVEGICYVISAVMLTVYHINVSVNGLARDIRHLLGDLRIKA